MAGVSCHEDFLWGGKCPREVFRGFGSEGNCPGGICLGIIFHETIIILI